MTIETGRQLQIVKAAKAAGGHGWKASNAYTSGIPDLVLVLPGWTPVIVEVKDLGDVGDKPFHRKVETTPLQRETMEQVNRVAAPMRAAFVLVTFKRRNTIYVAALPAEAVCINSKEIERSCRTLSELNNLAAWSSLLWQMGVSPATVTQH